MKIVVLPMSSEPILLRPATKDGARYLLERADGVVVPLVPADELPEDIRLTVKRTMTMDEAFALGIQVVALKRQDIQPKTPAENPAKPAEQPAPSTLRLSDRPKARIANAVRQKAGSSLKVHAGSVSEPDSEPQYQCSERRPAGEPSKRYCSYWIHYGSCDFDQQGCKFLHEMPDRETLRSIGFRTVPRWWVNKTMGDRTQPARSRTPIDNRGRKATHGGRTDAPVTPRRGSVDSVPAATVGDLIDLSPESFESAAETPPTSVSSVDSDHSEAATMGYTEAHLLPPLPLAREEIRARFERVKEQDRACIIRRRGGQREAYLPPKSRRCGRARRGMRA